LFERIIAPSTLPSTRVRLLSDCFRQNEVACLSRFAGYSEKGDFEARFHGDEEGCFLFNVCKD